MGGSVLSVENMTTPNEERYTWRHNNVPRVLCNAIVRKVQQRNQDNQKDKRPLPQLSVQPKHITKKKTFYGDLSTSNDCTVFFELPELKVFSVKHFPQMIQFSW